MLYSSHVMVRTAIQIPVPKDKKAQCPRHWAINGRDVVLKSKNILPVTTPSDKMSIYLSSAF